MTMPVNALSSALQQMQSMAAQAAGSNSPVADQSGAATAGGFASALKASLDKISGDAARRVDKSNLDDRHMKPPFRCMPP